MTSSNDDVSTARKFFDACESGKGWAGCSAFCHDDATFACQADALAEIGTLEAYTEWMAGLFTPMPDARYEVMAFSRDPDTDRVTAVGVFHATHTGDGGPVPPTGKSLTADYVYVMDFDDGRIAHMTKIWNDGYSLRQVGWM